MELDWINRGNAHVGPLTRLEEEGVVVGKLQIEDSGMTFVEGLLGNNASTTSEEGSDYAPDDINTPEDKRHNDDLKGEVGVADMREKEIYDGNGEDNVEHMEYFVLDAVADRRESEKTQNEEDSDQNEASEVIPFAEELIPSILPVLLIEIIEEENLGAGMDQSQDDDKISHTLVEKKKILPGGSKEIREQAVGIPVQRKQEKREQIFQDIAGDVAGDKEITMLHLGINFHCALLVKQKT